MSASGARGGQKAKRATNRALQGPGSGVHKRVRGAEAAAAPIRVLLVPAASEEVEIGEPHVMADGFEIESVGSGAAAIELLLVDGRFELVLCAAQMSDVTACEFLDNLRWLVPGRRPPVIVFGQSSPTHSQRSHALGAARCLPEECGPETLSRELVLLRESGFFSPEPTAPAPTARGGARLK